ncbi:MAG: hypothetical protein ACE37E_10400 [Hyphomicrobiales bacterium]
MEISCGQLLESWMFNALTGCGIEPLAIVADKAYASNQIRRQIADEGALATISAISNARTPVANEENLYAMSNIVERFFCRMKDMHRLANRFEKSRTQLP